MEEKRQRILNAGFELFSTHPIESVTMPEVAEKSGVGRATLYRYYSSKTELVIAIGSWKWADFYREYSLNFSEKMLEPLNAAQRFELYINAFIELYRNHKDVLRFNQFFNIYIQGQAETSVQMSPYSQAINVVAERFHTVYTLAQMDGTLRTDIPEAEMFATAVHLMMAAATRYVLGLVYRPENSLGPEQELLLLKQMILREYGSFPNKAQEVSPDEAQEVCPDEAQEVCPAAAAKPAQQDCTPVRSRAREIARDFTPVRS